MNKRNILSVLAVVFTLSFLGLFTWALFNHETFIVMTYLITLLSISIFILCAKVYIEIQLYFLKKEIKDHER